MAIRLTHICNSLQPLVSSGLESALTSKGWCGSFFSALVLHYALPFLHKLIKLPPLWPGPIRLSGIRDFTFRARRLRARQDFTTVSFKILESTFAI